jgi:hypothetical protein
MSRFAAATFFAPAYHQIDETMRLVAADKLRITSQQLPTAREK